MVLWGPLGLIAGAAFGAVLALRILRYVRGNQQGRHARRNNIFLVSGFMLAVPLLVAALVWNGNQYQYPPSDQQLIRNFRFHRAEFDELAKMKQADKGLMRVNSDFTQPDNPQTVGVSVEQIVKYRSLLTYAGIHQGLSADGLNGADFIVWAQGGATSSDKGKGYAYLTVPPSRTFSSLDSFREQSQSEGLPETQAYRPIEGHWYLYYEYLLG